jgi:hypothetical protein
MKMKFHQSIPITDPVSILTVMERDHEGRIWLCLPGLNALNLTSLYHRVQYGTDYMEQWAKVHFDGGSLHANPDTRSLTSLEWKFVQHALAEYAKANPTLDQECALVENLVYRIQALLCPRT